MRFLFARKSVCSLVVIPTLVACLVPVFSLAQAGSGAFTLFESASSFHDYIASAGQSDSDVPGGLVPESVWMLPASSSSLLWVDLEKGRLNLLEHDSNGGLYLHKAIPASIGKQGIGKLREGDQKTPVGNYRVTTFLSDDSIDDFYGLGAYPLDYPNAVDRRLARTGHGIWLHGLSKDIQERPFLDSDGCVVIDNQSLLELRAVMAPGETQVVLSRHEIKWVTVAEQEKRRQPLVDALLAWEDAWERRDNDVYLSFYADDFSDFTYGKAGWDTYKRRVNDSKSFIELHLSDMSMLVDPEQEDIVRVRFVQKYASNNYNWKGWKEQLWRYGDTGWQIIYEGSS